MTEMDLIMARLRYLTWRTRRRPDNCYQALLVQMADDVGKLLDMLDAATDDKKEADANIAKMSKANMYLIRELAAWRSGVRQLLESLPS